MDTSSFNSLYRSVTEMDQMIKEKQPAFRSKLEEDNAKLLDEHKIDYDFEPKWGKLKYVFPLRIVHTCRTSMSVHVAGKRS